MFDTLMDNTFLSGGLTLMAVGAAMAMLRRLPSELWGFVVRRLTISIEIPDRDPAYRWVQSWLAQQSYAQRARNLSLTTTWASVDPDPDVDGDPAYGYSSGRLSEAKFVLSPAPGLHFLTYRGRPLILHRHRRDLEAGGALAFQETLVLQVVRGSRGIVESLLREAHQAALPKVEGVNILSATRHGGWQVHSWRPRRPLASIVLAEGLLDEMLTDLRAFLGSGPWYTARGIPHRRGYLLHGPPGNGKTTLVTAAAAEFGLSVAALSLNGKLMTDETLRDLVDNLPSGTALLIEDVDCAFGPARASSLETGVTLSGLLNALDGVSSREGRVLFLTTNHPERLDPALVRPGRVDRRFHLGQTTPDQARRLFEWFHGGGEADPRVTRLAREFAAAIPPGRVCMAAIQEHLLRYRDDPEAAARKVDLGAGAEPGSSRDVGEGPRDRVAIQSTAVAGADPRRSVDRGFPGESDFARGVASGLLGACATTPDPPSWRGTSRGP
ncbi:MAG: AAA family ATPase, partial [Isosphaeraceae bacterium]